MIITYARQNMVIIQATGVYRGNFKTVKFAAKMIDILFLAKIKLFTGLNILIGAIFFRQDLPLKVNLHWKYEQGAVTLSITTLGIIALCLAKKCDTRHNNIECWASMGEIGNLPLAIAFTYHSVLFWFFLFHSNILLFRFDLLRSS